MAEEQKNIEVPKDTKVEEAAPVTAPVVAEAPKEETPATTEAVAATPAPVAEATEDKPAETAEEVKAEEVKEEVKPIEEGHLNHKAQGLSFPKNLIGSKEFFFFGTEAFEPKSLSSYQKSEKNAETAHTNIAWASHTGNGLLFIGDKKAPTGIVNLSDASEPVVEGTHKFTLTSKGNKHSFKAANTAERDNWVSQLKLKIAEAKELAATVSESETYKKTLESFKPAPVVKEEKAVEAPKEETKVEEPVKAEEPAKEEAAKEEKAETPKPLKSKRASFFGFIKKDETKEEEKETKAEEAKTEETPVVAADKPAEEAVAPAVAPAATEPATEAVTAEETPAEKAAEEDKPAESPKEKTSKRNSFFGGVFSKKEKKAAEPKPAEAAETPKEEVPPTTETAPVIPPVESTTPLAVDVSSPATVPTETTEAAAPTNGEPKKDVKEKRKSSLPFLGKREKSPSPSEGEEKSSQSAFSKLRATIKGKASPKAEKPTEEATKEETPAVADESAEVKATETPAEAVKEEEPVKAAEPEPETKPENVAATTTPAVTAAA